MYGPSDSLENHPGLSGETTKSKLIIDNSFHIKCKDVFGVLPPSLRVEIVLAEVFFLNVAFLVLFDLLVYLNSGKNRRS